MIPTNPIYIYDDNKLLTEDLIDALRYQTKKTCEIEAYSTDKLMITGSHLIFDVGLKIKCLIELLRQQKGQRVNIWLISGRSKQSIENFRNELIANYSEYSSWVRKIIFRKPIDEKRLLAVLIEREGFEKNKGKKDDLTKESSIYLNMQRPARLIDEGGVVVKTNSLWEKLKAVPPLPKPYSDWVKKVRTSDNQFLEETKWLRKEDGVATGEKLTKETQGYFKVRSYAMRDSKHILQYISKHQHVSSWESEYSEKRLIELSTPVMEVLTAELFTRARLYRVMRYPDRGIYKKALYSIGKIRLEKFEGKKQGCTELYKRLDRYEKEWKSAPKKLLCDIVESDEADDYWNNIVGMEGVPNWLEVPIIVRSEKRSLKTVALLVFDRKPEKTHLKWNEEGTRLWNYKAKIKEEEITDQETLLLEAIQQISNLFQQRSDFENLENSVLTSKWIHLAKPEYKADKLAKEAMKLLIEKFKKNTPELNDYLLVRIRGMEASVIYQKQEDNIISLQGISGLTTFEKSKCLYPNDPIPEWMINTSLDVWNKDSYRIFSPVISGDKLWYIMAFSRKASNDLDNDCAHCWYRHDKNVIRNITKEMGGYFGNTYTAQMTANSTQRIFMHEAVSLFTGIKNSFPKIYRTDPQFQSMLQKMKRMRYFLDNMRRISGKYDSKKKSHVPAKVVKESLKEILQSVDEVCEIRKLTISGKNTLSYEDIVLDKFSLELIVYNLINNAARYASGASIIYLESDSDVKYWIFSMRNQIDYPLDYNQEKQLFDAYVTYSQSDRNQGIGLGLANSKRMMQSVGGDLTVKQNRKSKEITFTVTCPLYTKKVLK